MKKIFQTVLFAALGIAFLASCKKETMNPATPEGMASETPARSGGGILNPAKTYTLVKHGATELSYYGDGRLSQVKTSTEVATYNYGGFGEIYITRKSGNLLTGKDTFLLDATGKCFYSHTQGYSYFQNGMITTHRVRKYVYNANGQLEKAYNPSKPNQREVYGYDLDGDLASVALFDETNKQTSITKSYSTYLYKTEKTPAKFDINPAHSFVGELYLKIFGKFNKNLFKRVEFTKLAGFGSSYNHRIQFILNADNVMTETKTYDAWTGKLLYTTPFNWITSN